MTESRPVPEGGREGLLAKVEVEGGAVGDQPPCEVDAVRVGWGGGVLVLCQESQEDRRQRELQPGRKEKKKGLQHRRRS